MSIRQSSVALWIVAMPAFAQGPMFEFRTIETFKIPGLEIDSAQSRSLSFGDYNNDGRPDLFISETGGRLHLFENEGGQQLVSRSFNIQDQRTPHEKDMGAVWGDFDNDGDLDLHVPIGPRADGVDSHHAMMVQRNDEGVFRVVTDELGLTSDTILGNSVWLDYDHDGRLDLYVAEFGNSRAQVLRGGRASPERRNRLYRNRPDGWFEDVTEAAGLGAQLSPVTGSSSGSGMVVADFDGDGYTDIFAPAEESSSRLFLGTGAEGFAEQSGAELFVDIPSGVAVGDIDNDGDFDLIVTSGGFEATLDSPFRGQLLFNLGGGRFVDVAAGAGLGDLTKRPSQLPRLGDIDNDGDLDLLVTLGAPRLPPVEQVVFINNGDGSFSSATSEAGLSVVPIHGSALGDYDGDGWLDVVFGGLVDFEAAFPRDTFPTYHSINPPSLGIGACLGCRRVRTTYPVYRNLGGDAHWLRVELVGVESNRSAIGARVFATSGDLRQLRQIQGGDGLCQDEMVAHFGLGPRTVVDRLEVHWPSGFVEVIEGVGVDQKVRLIEGSGFLHAVRPTMWSHSLPDIQHGATIDVEATVEPALFDPASTISSVSADLSAFGASDTVPLEALGDGRWRLATELRVAGQPGVREISVMIRQQTSIGPHWTRISKTISVRGGTEGLVLFDDRPAPGWRVEGVGAATVDPLATEVVHRGTSAQALTIGDDEVIYRAPPAPDTGIWLYPSERPGIDLQPFTHLSFWMHSNQAAIDSLFIDTGHGSVVIPIWGPQQVRARVSLIGTQKTLLPDVWSALYEIDDIDERMTWLVARDAERGMWDLGIRYLNLDLPVDDWVEVHVPIDSLVGFEQDRPLTEVRFSGKVDGTIYIDELRLTSDPNEPITAVTERHTDATPTDLALHPNYPNPFNPETVIPFDLPAYANVELAVYNVAGQRVATLINGERAPGSYQAVWDGRNDAGVALASGMYFYRLTAGEAVHTRKLLLLR